MTPVLPVVRRHGVTQGVKLLHDTGTPNRSGGGASKYGGKHGLGVTGKSAGCCPLPVAWVGVAPRIFFNFGSKSCILE